MSSLCDLLYQVVHCIDYFFACTCNGHSWHRSSICSGHEECWTAVEVSLPLLVCWGRVDVRKLQCSGSFFSILWKFHSCLSFPCLCDYVKFWFVYIFVLMLFNRKLFSCCNIEFLLWYIVSRISKACTCVSWRGYLAVHAYFFSVRTLALRIIVLWVLSKVYSEYEHFISDCCYWNFKGWSHHPGLTLRLANC